LPPLEDLTRAPAGGKASTGARDTSFWSPAAERNVEPVESHPVFVLGAARSGSTALCLALEKGTRYRGFPEGHVLDIATRLVGAVNAHFEKKDAWIPRKDLISYHFGHVTHAGFQAEIFELLRRLAGNYTTPFWFDKTPTYQMVASVPIISQAWPNSRFIFTKRRGLENMRSRILKFAANNFRGSCQDWALIMSGWRTMRNSVPGRYVELDQRALLTDPGWAAARIGRLLDLNDAEIKGCADVLCHERPEATDPSGSIVTDVSELRWSAEQMETFRSICGAEMEAYGYTYDSQYCRSS